MPPEEQLSSLFFFTNSAGIVYLANDSESCPEICRVVEGKLKYLLFYEEDNSIILITNNSILVKCPIKFTENPQPKKIKLSIPGKPENTKACWAGLGILALVNEDDMIRLFNVNTDKSFFLSINDHYKSNICTDDIVNSVGYSSKRRTLFAGSKQGKIYLWKNNTTNSLCESLADSWEPYSIVNAIPNINLIETSLNSGLVCVRDINDDICMLSETILRKKSNNLMKIVQTSHKTIDIFLDGGIGKFEDHNYKSFEVKDSIKGLEISGTKFIIWNDVNIHIYEVREKMNVVLIKSLKITSNLVTFNEDSVLVSNKNCIDVYTYEGEKKNEVVLEDKLGDIKLFYSYDRFLLVVTKKNYFGVYDIQRRNIKLIVPFKLFEREGRILGDIRDAILDSNGKKILFLSDIIINNIQRIPDTIFFLYNIETEQYFESEISKNRIPVEAYFDSKDNRIIGIYTEHSTELKDIAEKVVDEKEKSKIWIGPELHIFFHTIDNGIVFQEKHLINKDLQGVFGISIPDIYFVLSNELNNKNMSSYHQSQEEKNYTKELRYKSLLMRKFLFFAGMIDINDDIKESIIEFSIFMSVGKIDEAYKSVKNIKNEKIWNSIAGVCIKSKRLDVLEICLSNMRFSIGIKALREASHEKEIEVKLAMVAMHLGMTETAKDLLEEVKRYDILIRFYISIGEYENAINIAKTKHRINLENTYYRIAQHFEKNDEIDKAIEFYNLSGCGAREIPRMLINKNLIDLLEKHMSLGKDNSSIYWWAAYLETNGQIEKALEYYEKASDWVNVVRIHLAQDRVAQAKKITDETKDTGACFLMGKYYESIGDIQKAIYYYALSGRINQAFRLAKDHNMDAEIYNLGLKANAQTQNLIAEYFEKKGVYDKAIDLYMLAKNIKTALNLCLISNNYEKINEIAEMIEVANDPDLLRKLAEYFIEQMQYERGLGIYIKLKDWDKCLSICENYKVKISLNTANNIIKELDNEVDSADKEKLTLRLASQLKEQGDFDLAHSIYAKYGDLKKAMKCLILWGNKDRVISFANTCRQNELYIMAANFLQSLDWTDDVVKNIVLFFNKAKAWVNLANYYETFASVEISESRNYKKALELYDEALKVIINKLAENDPIRIEKEEDLNNRIKMTKIYGNALDMAISNPEESLALCNKMLNLAGVDKVVREVDIYSLMLEVYLRNKNYSACSSVLQVLKSMNLKVTKFVDKETIEIILKSVGKQDLLKDYLGEITNNQDQDDVIEEMIN